MEAELVLEVGAENTDKAGRCQQVRLHSLTMSRGGEVKFFGDFQGGILIFMNQ